MKKLIIVLLFSLFATGCTKTEDYLRDMVIKNSDLIDPSSAMFRNLTVKDLTRYDEISTIAWCGEINVKNSIGAYAGWKEFIMSRDKSGTIDITFQGSTENRLWDIYKSLYCGTEKPESWIPFWEAK
jgi:hypothetical protein